MEYLHAYLNEISRHLPRKNRKDIIEEIHSVLLDIIEERCPGKDADEATIKAVLNTYGSPRKVAQQYIAYQPLVGPELFQIYLLVLKIVLIVIAAINLIGAVIAVVNGSFVINGLFIAIVDRFFDLLGSLVNVFGMVTLVFVFLERFTSREFKNEVREDWSAEDLDLVEDPTRISNLEMAIEIAFSIIFILLFNIYLDKIGIYYQSDAGWIATPIFTETIRRYIPWLTLIWVFDISLNLYLIHQGKWDRKAVVAKVIINVLNIALLAAMIFGPAILSIEPAGWEALNLKLELNAQQFTQYLNTALKAVLGLSISVMVIDIIKHLVRNFIKKDQPGLKNKID